MPRRRSGLAFAALAAGGLAVLGAAGLVPADGPGLPLLAVSTAAQGQAPAGNQPEAVARATLPPARGIAAAKGDVMSDASGHGAPRHVDSGTWRLPPPEAGTARPVIALGAGDQPAGNKRDRSGQVTAVAHGGAAAAFAPKPAAVPKTGRAPAAEEASRPRRTHLGLHMAQRRAEQASRHGKPSYDNRPALRPARTISMRVPPSRKGEDNRLRSPAQPAFGPTEARAAPVPARQSRTAIYPPAGGLVGRASEPAADHAEYTPAAAAGVQRPADWNNRGFASAGRIEEAGSGMPEPSAAGRAEYAPAAAAEWRRSAAWGNLDPSPQPQTRTIIEGRVPPFAVPPPPPPRFRYAFGAGRSADWGPGPGQVYPARWRPRFRAWGPPGPPPPRFRYAPGTGPSPDREVYPARWPPPFRAWGPAGPPPP